MADWDGLRNDLERGVEPPPFQALRERRRRRQQRRAVAATFAVVLVGTASGVAILGQNARHRGPSKVAGPSVADRIALGDKLPASYVYKDYVVTDVDFVSPDTGWAIGLRCADEQCDVQTWRTDDGGRSWRGGVPVTRHVPRASYSAQDPSGGGVRSLRMVDATEGFAFNPDLYVTHDGARTWTRVPQQSKVASLSVVGTSVWAFERGCPADDDCNAVLRVGTLGPDFALNTVPVPKTSGASAIVRRSDTAHGYLLSYDSPAAALRRTTDGGSTWASATHPCPGAVAAALSTGRDRPLWVVCTTAIDAARKTSTKKAYQSTDNGTTWRELADLPASGTLTDLVSVSATTAYATVQDPARLLVTTDAGTTWRTAAGTATRAFGYANLDAVDQAHVWAMGDAGILWRTVDGTTWERLALPPGGPRATGTPKALPKVDVGVQFTGLSFVDTNRGWVVGQRCVKSTCRAVLRRTDDGGETWSPVNAPTGTWRDDIDSGHQNSVESVTFADDRNGWLYGPNLFVTHDGGVHWTALHAGIVGDLVVRGRYVWVLRYHDCETQPCGAVVLRGLVGSNVLHGGKAFDIQHASFTAVDETHVYVVADGTADATPRIATTGDGGKTWRTHAAPCTDGIRRAINARAIDDLWVVCGFEGGGGHEPHTIARSSDGGAHWRTVRGDGEGYAFELRVVSRDVAWRTDAGMAAGLRVTRDGGRTWRTDLTESSGGGFHSLVLLDATHGFTLSWEDGVYRMTDGQHWEPVPLP